MLSYIGYIHENGLAESYIIGSLQGGIFMSDSLWRTIRTTLVLLLKHNYGNQKYFFLFNSGNFHGGLPDKFRKDFEDVRSWIKASSGNKTSEFFKNQKYSDFQNLCSPIPLAYSVHLHHSVWLYLLSLPYQLVGANLGWWAIPIVGLGCFW
jgi:hypothetical protein